MNLTLEDVKNAQLHNIVRPVIPTLAKREHLLDVNIRKYFPELSDFNWNMLMNLLALSARKQPFGDPYLWQSMDRHSFVQWLESWKV